MRLDEETPLPYAKDVEVPTLMTQLRRDFSSTPRKMARRSLTHWEQRRRNCSGSKNRTSGFTLTTTSGNIPNV
jgi:hypothetical protein